MFGLLFTVGGVYKTSTDLFGTPRVYSLLRYLLTTPSSLFMVAGLLLLTLALYIYKKFVPHNFATSVYKSRYDRCVPPKQQCILFHSLLMFLRAYANYAGKLESVAEQMFEVLQAEILNCEHWENLQEVDPKRIAVLALVLWSSARRDGFGKEFCSILNEVIRDDVREVMEHAVVLCRAMNTLIVTNLGRVGAMQADGGTCWPADFVTHRGTSMPLEELQFFKEGRVYRAPMFLATSFDESTATDFMRNTPAERVPVHFKFLLDRNSKCDHALYLEHYTLVRGEKELLYVPYSAFKVKSVFVPDQPRYGHPAVIELEVFPNNQDESEDVPLSTWH